jgi:hypothetical protein
MLRKGLLFAILLAFWGRWGVKGAMDLLQVVSNLLQRAVIETISQISHHCTCVKQARGRIQSELCGHAEA